jgi:hypothetical protein
MLHTIAGITGELTVSPIIWDVLDDTLLDNYMVFRLRLLHP